MNQAESDRQAHIDSEHLRLLAIFHYVAAGLGLVGVMFSSAYFFLFQVILSNPRMWEKSPQGPPPDLFIGVFRWFILVFVVWYVVAAVGNLLSAQFLRKNQHRTFSMVMAAINCLHVPIGTVLGVLSFIVLTRSSVLRRYESESVSQY